MSDTALERKDAPRLEGAFAALRDRLWLDRSEAAVSLRVVYAGVAAYAVLFIFLAVVHYSVFESARFDLGNMVQAIWNTLHGHFLETTTQSGNQRSRLGFHVDPFLVLLAPLFWIWSSPLLLPVVQAIAVASGALPVFWLARKHLDSPRAGAMFAFAYLLYPATQFSAFTVTSSFHPVAIAVPLVLYAVWFLDEDRLVVFSVVALLAFATKEEMPLAVGCLGIWYAVRKKRWAFGFGLFALGLAVTLFDFLWVIPHFSATGGNPFSSRYAAVGGTPSGIVRTLFTDPLSLGHAVASAHSLLFLALLLVPFLGLCFFEPLLLLGAVPELAITLLSSRGSWISSHWTEGAVPFVVAASIFGASRFRFRSRRLASGVLLVTACVAVFFNAISFLFEDLPARGSASVAAQERAVSLIPDGVPVTATNELGGHLSERRYIFMFPAVRHARWIVVNANDSTYHHPPILKARIRAFESDPGWHVVFSSHGVVVLHKRPTG
jgi:uncharacterized membrane protein